jgi:flagellar protein FliO/FliZ
MKRFVFRCSELTALISVTRKLLQVATAALAFALPYSAFAQSAPGASEPAAASSGGLGWFGGELLLLTLIAVCAWTVFYVFKRKRQGALGNGNERVHVLGMTSLGVRERVMVLRVRERTLLVGVTAAQITLLADLDAARDAGADRAEASAAPKAAAGLSAQRPTS